MISLKVLLDIVSTESLEQNRPYLEDNRGKRNTDLPPIRYDLELIESEDGSLYWVE